MLWVWTEEDQDFWTTCASGIDALFTAWLNQAADAAAREPAVKAFLSPQADAVAWFRAHLEQHRAAFCGAPTDPERRDAARRVGFAHIQAHVPPSWYVSLYNLMFSAYHEMEATTGAPRLPPLTTVRRRWLGDMETTLDTYAVALATQITTLRDLTLTDPLTGLLNRRGLWQRVAQDVQAGATSAAFVLFDLDHFKTVNDDNGHPEGDLALQDVAVLAQRFGRAVDALARLGGDEFAWWAAGLSGLDPLRRRLRRLAQALYRTRRLTFSAGVAWYPHDGRAVDELYHAADVALYRAKFSGRHCWTESQHSHVFPLSITTVHDPPARARRTSASPHLKSRGD